MAVTKHSNLHCECLAPTIDDGNKHTFLPQTEDNACMHVQLSVVPRAYIGSLKLYNNVLQSVGDVVEAV